MSIQSSLVDLITLRTKCEMIQDVILIIESHMGGDQQFTFDINREISSIQSVDINSTINIVDRYVNV